MLIILSVGLLFVAALVSGAVWMAARFVHQSNLARAADAAYMIADEVGYLLEENPEASEAEIREIMVHLVDASVIHLRRDAEGQVVDPWGHRFVVTWERGVAAPAVTCVSRGADGLLGTADDISYPPPAGAR